MLFDIPKQILTEIGQVVNGKNEEKLSESQLRSLLQAALRKCELVSREEFDAQRAVLERTREKLDALEHELVELKKTI